MWVAAIDRFIDLPPFVHDFTGILKDYWADRAVQGNGRWISFNLLWNNSSKRLMLIPVFGDPSEAPPQFAGDPDAGGGARAVSLDFRRHRP